MPSRTRRLGPGIGRNVSVSATRPSSTSAHFQTKSHRSTCSVTWRRRPHLQPNPPADHEAPPSRSPRSCAVNVRPGISAATARCSPSICARSTACATSRWAGSYASTTERRRTRDGGAGRHFARKPAHATGKPTPKKSGGRFGSCRLAKPVAQCHDPGTARAILSVTVSPCDLGFRREQSRARRADEPPGPLDDRPSAPRSHVRNTIADRRSVLHQGLGPVRSASHRADDAGSGRL